MYSSSMARIRSQHSMYFGIIGVRSGKQDDRNMNSMFSCATRRLVIINSVCILDEHMERVTYIVLVCLVLYPSIVQEEVRWGCKVRTSQIDPIL